MTTTVDPVASALSRIPRQGLRCIGQYATPGGIVDYPISWADGERDATWARTALEGLGVRAGDFVTVVSTGHEAPWYAPILDAVYSLEATVCPLEPAGFELGRAEMFFQRFPISSIIGLDDELGSALAAELDLATLLSNMKFVLARPQAWHLVGKLAVPAGLIAPLGPAVGLGCGSAPVLHLDEAEWRINEHDGRLAVTTVGDRAHRADPTLLAQSVSLVPNHHCSCPYGGRAYAPVDGMGS
jgi:hypothetical protein